MKIVISGGASGIGLALAKHPAYADADVYILDVTTPSEPIANATFIKCDITDEHSLKSAFEKIGGGIDLLVSNAGIIRRGALFAIPAEQFDRLFAVNVKGSWLFIREAMPHLKDGATIFQMSSGHAQDPPDDPGVYALTKMCLANFAELMFRHYPRFNIKIAYPGPVETPLATYGLSAEEAAAKKSIMHSPEYVAERIVTLLSSNNSELRFNGDTWDYEIVPGILRAPAKVN